MGQVALAFGVTMLRKRASEQLHQVREQAESFVGQIVPHHNGAAPASTLPVPPPRHAPVPHDERVAVRAAPGAAPAAEPALDDGPARSASSAHLPIPGYDALSASQVVERLAGLGADELTAVRDYEAEHRNRRTILGKIDQLTP